MLGNDSGGNVSKPLFAYHIDYYYYARKPIVFRKKYQLTDFTIDR